jgi:glycosyltransferase involved in cell wall biosynthesis
MISKEELMDIRALARQGYGYAEIGRMVGRDWRTVKRYLELGARPVYRRQRMPSKLDQFSRGVRAADVVLVPSRRDAFSLVLLEAMASGKAIVATRVWEASALEGAGVLVNAEDPSAIASGLRGLLE